MFVLQWKNFVQLDLILFGSVLRGVPQLFCGCCDLLDFFSFANRVNVSADESSALFDSFHLQALHKLRSCLGYQFYFLIFEMELLKVMIPNYIFARVKSV